MTTVRVITTACVLWVALVLLTAFGAWFESDPVKSAAYNHGAWMFALSGGISAAFALFVWMAWALKNEVRTARSVGQRNQSSRCTVTNPVTAGAVRRETGEV